MLTSTLFKKKRAYFRQKHAQRLDLLSNLEHL